MESMNRLKPSLLIAMPNLIDPYFYKSVVLLVENDKTGSLGFILNFKSPYNLDEVLSERSEVPSGVAVWSGGPVESPTGFILHEKYPTRKDKVLKEGLFLSSDEIILDRMIADYQDDSFELGAYKFLLGYAGWGAGQLESEMKNGFWVEAPLDKELIFNEEGKDLWFKALEKIGVHDQNSLTAPHSFYVN